MKSQAIETLSQILTNNLGNKLTLELAHGIVSVLNQALPEDSDTVVNADDKTPSE